jgi:hypothetical protein
MEYVKEAPAAGEKYHAKKQQAVRDSSKFTFSSKFPPG